MRFIVYGAGAIGGVLGGRLQEHGHDVTVIARGRHMRAIAAGGLRIESPDRTRTVEIPAVDHPSKVEFTSDDVVLMAMKSQDTVAALDALAATAPVTVPVICAQNGVDNERSALRRFPNVYGMHVMCPAAHREPGVVQVFSAPLAGLFDVGRYPSGVDSLAEQVVATLASASFDARPQPDIMRWKYTKLLSNLGNAVEAACGPSAYGSPLLGLVRKEGVACLQAAGIDFASEEEDAERRGDLMRIRPINGERRQGGSSWQSLDRGRGSIEADYLNGEIVLLGRLHGVPTPANTLIQAVVDDLARKRRPPGSVAPERLLADLGVQA